MTTDRFEAARIWVAISEGGRVRKSHEVGLWLTFCLIKLALQSDRRKSIRPISRLFIPSFEPDT